MHACMYVCACVFIFRERSHFGVLIFSLSFRFFRVGCVFCVCTDHHSSSIRVCVCLVFLFFLGGGVSTKYNTRKDNKQTRLWMLSVWCLCVFSYVIFLSLFGCDVWVQMMCVCVRVSVACWFFFLSFFVLSLLGRRPRQELDEGLGHKFGRDLALVGRVRVGEFLYQRPFFPLGFEVQNVRQHGRKEQSIGRSRRNGQSGTGGQQSSVNGMPDLGIQSVRGKLRRGRSWRRPRTERGSQIRDAQKTRGQTDNHQDGAQQNIECIANQRQSAQDNGENSDCLCHDV